jgi:hypothetical protein
MTIKAITEKDINDPKIEHKLMIEINWWNKLMALTERQLMRRFPKTYLSKCDKIQINVICLSYFSLKSQYNSKISKILILKKLSFYTN